MSKNVIALYFSPTGGTKKVVRLLAGAWDGMDAAIDLSQNKENYSKYIFQREDICLVAVPSYGGRVPTVAAERLRQLTGGGAIAIPVVVYGNRQYDDTLLELNDVLTQQGFRCVAAVTAIAQHSIMSRYAANRPDRTDWEELKAYGKSIRSYIDSCRPQPLKNLPGNRPYKEFPGLPLAPKASLRCTKCGKCARLCPTGAIDLNNPKKTDKNKCITCMRCQNICPKKARSIPKVLIKIKEHKMKDQFAQHRKNELFLGSM